MKFETIGKARWLVLWLVTVAGLVASACTSGEASVDNSFDGPSVDGPLVITFPRNSGEDALIIGVVGIDKDGCVTVDGAVAAWPPGTTWDDITESITLPDGTTVTSGDSVEGGGGYHNVSALEFFVAEEGIELALECTSSEVAVFNSEPGSVKRIDG